MLERVKFSRYGFYSFNSNEKITLKTCLKKKFVLVSTIYKYKLLIVITLKSFS